MPGVPAVPFFNSSTPAAPMGYQNVKPQTDGGTPVQMVSFYVPAPMIVFSLQGFPPAVTVFPWICVTRPISFAANFAGSAGQVLTNPTATATFTVKKISSGTTTTIGTIVVSTGGVVTFTTTSGAVQSLITGDLLTLTTPTADATLQGVAFTLTGTS